MEDNSSCEVMMNNDMQHGGYSLLLHLTENLLIYTSLNLFLIFFFTLFNLKGSEAERIPAEDYVKISGIFHNGFLIETSQT